MYLFQSISKAMLALSLSLFASFTSQSQEQTTSFGAVTSDEWNLKECSFDKSADAVILLDQGVSYFDDDYKLITERRIRLKILKDKGVNRANIQIPYYSRDGFEVIRDINAAVVTPGDNGERLISFLEKKNIFKKQVNDLYSLISFALPNVKVGSIIEYKYNSVMKSYAGLRNWEFQSEIPVLVSSFELAPIPNSEFAYTVYKSRDLPIKIDPNKTAGRVRFEMHNVPGLRDEVFMTTAKNYLQRVNFQFSSYKGYFGKSTYTSTWQQLATELSNEKSFGKQAGKDLSNTSLIKGLPQTLSAEEKIKAIHDYVKTNIVWNNIYSKFCEEGVKDILEKKKGNSGDINLLLISLLQNAGLEAYPLLVSERDHGNVDTTYSYLDQFNKVVAYVAGNGRQYILDGTDVSSPYFMVPTNLVNTIGFIVDRKKRGFVYLNNLPHKQQEYIGVTGTLSEDGLLKGTAVVRNLEYAKVEKESRYKSDKARYQESLVKPYPFLKVDSFSVDGLKDDSAALKQQLSFQYALKQAGGYYILNYNLFTGLNDNPFVTQYRFTDIDFGTKYSGLLTGSFFIPSTFNIETLPPNKKLVSPDKSMSVSRIIERNNNQLNLKVAIEINREKYPASEYEIVKAFFKQLVDLLNEPVLLKSK